MSCDDGVAVRVQAAGAPGVTAAVPADVRDTGCCVLVFAVLLAHLVTV
jgi:hypothetical protein